MTLVLHATIESGAVRDIVMRDLTKLASEHPGNDILEFEILTDNGARWFRVTQMIDSWDRVLRVELEQLLGVSLHESSAP